MSAALGDMTEPDTADVTPLTVLNSSVIKVTPDAARW
jgi:hypothetical protein